MAGLIDELSAWPGTVIASHKSAGQPFHKLTLLADLGVRVEDPGVEAIVSAILERRSDEGPFQLPMNIGPRYGGSGTDEWAWALCDAPLIVYALAKMGLRSDPRVKAAITHLVGLVRDNGWPCAVSKELGAFRGPGRRDDPSPVGREQRAASVPVLHGHGLPQAQGALSSGTTCCMFWTSSRASHGFRPTCACWS